MTLTTPTYLTVRGAYNPDARPLAYHTGGHLCDHGIRGKPRCAAQHVEPVAFVC